jgi:hypothetical protein
MFQIARYSALVTAALVTACGGGGSDNSVPSDPSPPAPVSSAEGFWTGKASTGFDVSLAVLDNGETWGVYTRGGFIYGALYGNTTSSNSTFTGSGREFDLTTGSVTSSSYTGTYTGKTSLNAQLPNNTTFAASYGTTYDQPASLSALAGTYSGYGVATGAPVQPMSVSISAAGVISAPPSLGCSVSGSVSPRPGGKNVFAMSITFAGTSCALGNGATATGVAYHEGGKLLSMGLLPSKVAGFIFTGQK